LRPVYIVNPTSGGGRGLRVWRALETILERRGLPAEHRLTESRGSAILLAARAREEGYDPVIAVGGDGTVQEVVNGLIDADGRCPAALGVIPGGTGNDFAKMLGYPPTTEGALEVVLGRDIRRIDLGRANGRYFINIAGVGFDAEVAGFLNRRPKRLPGALSYVYGVLAMLLRYRPAPLVMALDDTRLERKCLLVSVCNGPAHAGGMKMVPEARPDDGILHICVAGDLTRPETLILLPKVFSGRHTLHRKVEIYTTRRITITSPLPLVLQADGEVLGQVPAEIEAVPGVLRVIGRGPLLAGAPAPRGGEHPASAREVNRVAF
jgi:YegS/Rv2252/BmrU family lipid kinase